MDTECPRDEIKHTDYLHEQDDDLRPEFRGSFSIKSVLPVLVPGMGYDDLEVADGLTASVLYMQALENRDNGSDS